MPLAFRVFFEGIRDCDCPVAQVLAVHGLDGGIGCLETCEVDESETFRVACVGVALDLKIKLILKLVSTKMETFSKKSNPIGYEKEAFLNIYIILERIDNFKKTIRRNALLGTGPNNLSA